MEYSDFWFFLTYSTGPVEFSFLSPLFSLFPHSPYYTMSGAPCWRHSSWRKLWCVTVKRKDRRKAKGNYGDSDFVGSFRDECIKHHDLLSGFLIAKLCGTFSVVTFLSVVC